MATTKNSILNYHYHYHRRLRCPLLYNISASKLSMQRRSQMQTQMPLFTVSCNSAAITAQMKTTKKNKQEKYGGFLDEMRNAAMKLHTPDQSKEGKAESGVPPVDQWKPTVEGYLKFLVDSKCIFDIIELMVQTAKCYYYAEFRNTGLERSEKLAKDLDWFRKEGFTIPEPSSAGVTYACYLKELVEKEPHAFICHLYNIYFAHFAGGKVIGNKVARSILNDKELEFYKFDGDLSELLDNVREKINMVACSWSREEKDRCLEETGKAFKYSSEILRLIFS